MTDQIDYDLLKKYVDILEYKISKSSFEKINEFIIHKNGDIKKFIDNDKFCNILISSYTWFTYSLLINILTEYLNTSNQDIFICKKNLITKVYYLSLKIKIEKNDNGLFERVIFVDKTQDIFVLDNSVYSEFESNLSDVETFFDKTLIDDYLNKTKFYKTEIYHILCAYISFKGMILQNKLSKITKPKLAPYSTWKSNYNLVLKWIIQIFHNSFNSSLNIEKVIVDSMYYIYYDILTNTEWIPYLEKYQNKKQVHKELLKYLVIQNTYKWLNNIHNTDLTMLIESFIDSIDTVKLNGIDTILDQ
jgi:hypothetical protein